MAPESVDKKLDKLDGKCANTDKKLTEYQLGVVQWHTKIRADLDHLQDEHIRRKSECGEALRKDYGERIQSLSDKVDALDRLITTVRIGMAKHAVWIGIGILVASVALNTVARYFLK